ncbi:Sialic acid-specific 9-O-acetylesterase [Mucinivorans hirudinis]|uniref:Sialic acid-specific 9-O-acetylesterase n=1 Tax=Mucinivorans hirudinis TaxID=1433126 RepID=A0A060R8V1_9BACT|nr:Sialic acid-specific 9-O-acetylesterase [Mucinivorans hirudinis]
MTRRYLWALLALLISTAYSYAVPSTSTKIKVACVGNSVTYGMTIENREQNSYPAQLQQMLGEDYQVGNFGRNGATLLNKGHNPYTKTEEYGKALEMGADIVIIHLGLNDTDPRNYPHYQEEFAPDYIALIDSFRRANPKVRVIVARLSPIFHTHWRFNAGTQMWYNKIQQEISRIAARENVELIDFQEVLYNHPDLLPDAIHPNKEGATLLAQRVYAAITGDFGGLQLSPLFSDNMVLQCSPATLVCGVANVGDIVNVTLGTLKFSTVTDKNGKWKVELPLDHYSTNSTLMISTRDKALEFNNVSVGEVWVLGGQSNMSWTVGQSTNPEKALENNNIRLFMCEPASDRTRDSLDAQTLERLNKLDYIRSQGWQSAAKEAIDNFSAIGFYFAQRVAAKMADTPIGLIQMSLGGAAAEGFVSREMMEADPLLVKMLTNWTKNPMVMQWCRDVGIQNTKGAQNPLQRHYYEPVFLYESRTKPLSDYTIKGVLWYQGESNADNTELHEVIFPKVVETFRKAYRNEQLPFYFVQLSGIESRPSWGRFRNSQRILADNIENCEMVVSFDYADPTDVHPRKKDVIGERLANVALARDYGFTNVQYQAPTVVRFEGNVLTFNNVAGGLKSSDGGAVRGFQASDDGLIFRDVEATIKGNKIILKIDNPIYVKYAWKLFTDANVVNGVGVPLSTFEIWHE